MYAGDYGIFDIFGLRFSLEPNNTFSEQLGFRGLDYFFAVYCLGLIIFLYSCNSREFNIFT